jgi:geranylgeranyl pyrophosphate synthase
MLKVDTKTLTDIINQCFDFSMDGRFSQAQRNIFLAEGKRLRGLLINLLSAQFDDGNRPLLDSNDQLSKVNAKLSDSTAALANVAQTLSDVATLVGNLDKLLNVAASFL